MTPAPLRLLLVDDQADHRLLLRANLEEQDPELGFAEAGSVEEALGHLRDRGADVVLCDFWLGGETGLDLLRRARAEGISAPFLLVTNHGSEELARQSFLEGVADYVTKEVALRNPADLARRIRRTAEKARLAAERHRAEVLLESFLTNNPFAILILDEDGQPIRWNPALERMESHPEDLERLRRYRPFEDPQLAEAGVRRLLERARGGEWVEIPPFPWDPVRAGLQGPVRILSGVAFPVTVAPGETYLCVMIQDVTLAETARRERDEYAAVLASLLNASPAAIVFVDVEGRVRFANRWIETFLGVDPKPFVGRPYAELAEALSRSLADPRGILQHPADPEACSLDSWSEAVEVARPERRHLVRTVGPVRGPGGRYLGCIEVFIDETGAIERQRLLEERNRELDAFASRLAHDLKTPLVSLKGFADLLARSAGPGLDERHRMFLERIRTSADLLNEMVDGLRELSRASRPAGELHDLDPLPLVKLAAEHLAAEADEAGVRIELPESVPLIRCERAKLFQIVQNLLANAIRYADPSKPDRWARISFESRGDRVVLEVADNGRGIDPEDLPHLFEPFRRGKSAGQTPGMGLGLALTHRLAQACGAGMEVLSRPGDGARFRVSFPAASAAPASPAA